MTTKRAKGPPKHLSEDSKKWWREVVRAYELDTHHYKLLEAACVCLDRMRQARRDLAEEGYYVLDRFEQTRPHPAHKVEKDNKTLFCRLVHQLGLEDVDLPKETRRPGRPPRDVRALQQEER